MPQGCTLTVTVEEVDFAHPDTYFTNIKENLKCSVIYNVMYMHRP